MSRRKERPVQFTTARSGADDGPDSDEEGIHEEQASAQVHSGRGNITGAELKGEGDIVITEAKSKKRITLSLKNQDNVVCAVCGRKGHTAGFIGAVYVDCPVKPCYLCKESGHTAATCPFRLDPTLNAVPAAGTSGANLANFLLTREVSSQDPRQTRPRNVLWKKHRWKICSACLKLHPRRVTALDFPPGSANLVCSADKKGILAVWDFEEVSEQAVYENVHEYQINDIKFLPGRDGMSLVSASCDGHVSVLDIESGSHYSLCDLNPGGWVDGVSNERNWKMMQCLAVHEAQPHLSWAGDNRGNLRCLDLRTKDVAWQCRVHAAGNKVTSLKCHPQVSNLLLTAGNDHYAKLFDLRMLRKATGKDRKVEEPLVSMEHPRVISAASFSPCTGNAIMTTCGDNRIRIWDDVSRAGEAPSRQLVHSHDFNRYLTPFKAVWDPKDTTERTVVVGRYISEDHGGLVLHPIDILDVGTGALLDSLVDANLQLINPVNVPHPTVDAIITGSSGHLYCWRPEESESDDDILLQDNKQKETEKVANETAKDVRLRGSKHYTVYEVASREKEKKQTKKS